ncbi:PRD domain-containing protein [Gracilibacillus sp. Marseille-QA3620]
MKIKKILNNNAAIVVEDNQEKIVIGSGIAFNKGKNDLINRNKIDKLFVMKNDDHAEQLLPQISVEHMALTQEIIQHAEDSLQVKLNPHIFIALADHLSFAIERYENGIFIKNKLLSEIRILYKKEFDIGIWAINYIEDKIGIRMPIDEAAFIALHLHTASVPSGNLQVSLRQTSIINEIIHIIQDYFSIHLEEGGLSYERLITHLRYTLYRTDETTERTMDEEMLIMVRKKFPASYNCAETIAEHLSQQHGLLLSTEEIGYITIHIERLRSRKG